MKNYQFSWTPFNIILVIIIVLTLGSFLFAIWESQQTLPCYLSSGCGASPPPGEKIAFDSYHVNSPTNVTLTISNAGAPTSALVEYFVKDSYGNMYSNTTWAGPTLSPGATAPVNILLSGKLSGQPFQIQSGHTYSVILVTSRNNQFPFWFTP